MWKIPGRKFDHKCGKSLVRKRTTPVENSDLDNDLKAFDLGSAAWPFGPPADFGLVSLGGAFSPAGAIAPNAPEIRSELWKTFTDYTAEQSTPTKR